MISTPSLSDSTNNLDVSELYQRGHSGSASRAAALTILPAEAHRRAKVCGRTPSIVGFYQYLEKVTLEELGHQYKKIRAQCLPCFLCLSIRLRRMARVTSQETNTSCDVSPGHLSQSGNAEAVNSTLGLFEYQAEGLPALVSSLPSIIY